MLKKLMLLLMLGLVGAAGAQTDDTLQDLLDSVRDAESPAVVIYVWTPDATYAAASGVVELGGDAATVEDRFRIGSVSKTYTAALTLMLVDAGLIDLDAPISTYLPDGIIAGLEGSDDVTTRHLLTMTSGLYEYLQDDFYDAVDDDPTTVWTPETALSGFAYGGPASFEPGTEFEYVNTNYLLLQLIIEAVTEDPIHVVMREWIFDEIGAESTYTQIAETLPGDFVRGYEDLNGDGELDDTFGINDGAGMGDGGLVASAADVALFYHYLLYEGELLDDATLETMLTDPLGDQYGMGIEVIDDPDYGMIYGHSGSVLGFTSDVRYFWEEDVIIVLLHADLDLDPDWIFAAYDAVMGE
jgi:D-alanyl-D-alanine carboxypeptidase